MARRKPANKQDASGEWLRASKSGVKGKKGRKK
jgi:hypothetical protein